MKTVPGTEGTGTKAVGLTLLEAMVAVAVLGALVSVATIEFVKSTERAYKRQARDTLRMIYAGEQTYHTLNDAYYDADTPSPTWERLLMDDPNPLDGSITYTIDAPSIPSDPLTGTGATFTAKATRNKGPNATKSMTLDQNQTFAGTW